MRKKYKVAKKTNFVIFVAIIIVLMAISAHTLISMAYATSERNIEMVTVTVKSGDGWNDIMTRQYNNTYRNEFLGDRLAKYNGQTNQSKLQENTTVEIPATAAEVEEFIRYDKHDTDYTTSPAIEL